MKKLRLLYAALLLGASYSSWAAEGEIEVWAWNINIPVLEKAAEEYKKINPNAEIKISDISPEDAYVKISVSLQARGVGLPDVMLIEDSYLRGYLENWPNAFTNLSSLGFDEYAKEFPEFKNLNAQIDGQYHAMPFDAGPMGIFYRISHFEKAGVDPNSIKTWDDYIEAGKKIRQATGAYMVEVRSDEETLVRAMIGSFDTHYFDKEGHIAFMAPEMLEVFEYIKKMREADILYTGAKGWDGFVQAISSSKIVGIPGAAWLAGTIEMQAPDLTGDWAVIPLPENSQGKNASNIGGSNFVIPSGGENIELAYDFMRFFTTSGDMQEVAFKGGLFPSYLPVYEKESFKAPVEYFNNQSIWAEFSKTVKDIPMVNYTMDYSMAHEEVVKALSDVVLKNIEPQKALNDAAKRLANQTGRKIKKYK